MRPAGQPACRCTNRSPIVTGLTGGNAWSVALEVKGFGSQTRIEKVNRDELGTDGNGDGNDGNHPRPEAHVGSRPRCGNTTDLAVCYT